MLFNNCRPSAVNVAIGKRMFRIRVYFSSFAVNNAYLRCVSVTWLGTSDITASIDGNEKRTSF